MLVYTSYKYKNARTTVYRFYVPEGVLLDTAASRLKIMSLSYDNGAPTIQNGDSTRGDTCDYFTVNQAKRGGDAMVSSVKKKN